MYSLTGFLLCFLFLALAILVKKHKKRFTFHLIGPYLYGLLLLVLGVLTIHYALVGFQANRIYFWQQTIYGISLGSVYALIALGYTMVYGIIKLINFAHGEIYMLGAYAGFFAVTSLELPFFLALGFAMVAASIAGVLVERIAYKPLRKAPRLAVLITAIGVSLLLQNVGQKVFGSIPRSFPRQFTGLYRIGDVNLDQSRVIVFIITFVLMAALQYFVHYTRPGRAMRAVSQDREAAQLMGINVNKTISMTFAVGSFLAGAAGILVAIVFPQIRPTMGLMPGLKAFVAAVIGGIGIIPGAVLGGLIIGISENLVTAYISSSWRDAIAFGLLIIILLVKPSGILGQNTREKV